MGVDCLAQWRMVATFHQSISGLRGLRKFVPPEVCQLWWGQLFTMVAFMVMTLAWPMLRVFSGVDC